MSSRTNKLRTWFAQKPKPMTKRAFAKAVGVTPAYVTQLTRDTPPWPSREVQRRISIVTKGFVTPNDLAGFRPRRTPPLAPDLLAVEEARSPGD